MRKESFNMNNDSINFLRFLKFMCIGNQFTMLFRLAHSTALKYNQIILTQV